MLQFLLGKSGTGKTYYARNIAADAAEKGQRVYFIVPDQYTFEYEKYFILSLTADKSVNIRVLSFNRLAEEILRVYGGNAVPRVDDSSSLLLMNLAIESCQDNLTVLKGNGIADSMIKIISEFKEDGVSPDDLLAAVSSDKSQVSKTLRDKLTDIELIYSAYEALLHQSYNDSADIIIKASEKIENKGYFADCVFIVDSFETIDANKSKLIYEALKSADKVYLSFCCGSIDANEISYFSPVVKTARKFRKFASENSIEILPSKYFSANRRTGSEYLQNLSENIFSDYPEVIAAKPDNINLYEANTVTEELEIAASKIRDLVIHKGYRYNEIAVMAHDASKYSFIMDSVCRKWNIPYFYSDARNLNTSPLVRFIFSAFSVVINRFRTEDILNLLKTDLTEFSIEDVSKLENYAYIWRIDGNRWNAPFTMNPEGLSGNRSDTEKINEVESLRKSLIGRLNTFKENIHLKTGAEITEALYDLIDSFGVSKRLQENIKFFRESNNQESADDLIRVWNKVANTLDTFVTVLGDKSLSEENYFELIKSILSSQDKQEVPLRSDTLIFGSLDDVIQNSPKAAFIIGAQNGELPYTPEATGLLTQSEKDELAGTDIVLENNLNQISLLEKFNTYKAVSSPTELLFISYHKKEYNEDADSGELVESILSIFPEVQVISDYPKDRFLNSDEAIFSYFASITRQENPIKPTIRAFIDDNIQLNERASKLNLAEDSKIIADKNISRKLISSGSFSASQIDTYHQCKFRYFCQYSLNTKERNQASVDVRIYGTLMHYIFENILKGDFLRYKDDDELLSKDLMILINRFKSEEISGSDKLLPTDEYRIYRLASTAFSLVKGVVDELSQSKFKPIGWEEQLGKKYPTFKIKAEDGQIVSVGGIIDRVDNYISNGQEYIRIVDYKTGTKVFRISEVVYGLNLQMLIYLAAICLSGEHLPAGILYFPAASNVFSMEKGSTEDQIKNERIKKQRMNGAILNSEEIIRAMEAAVDGRYIPVKTKKDGSYDKKSDDSLFTESEFSAIFDHIKKLLTTMANTIIEGDFRPNPFFKENHNSCGWCPYKSVCLSAKDDSEVDKDSLGKDEAMMLIRGDEIDA